jgi:hypothetical protein
MIMVKAVGFYVDPTDYCSDSASNFSPPFAEVVCTYSTTRFAREHLKK